MFYCIEPQLGSPQELALFFQDTVADLKDFEDLNDILQSEVDGGHTIYVDALKLIENNGIPYRSIRFERCSHLVFFVVLPGFKFMNAKLRID